MIKNHVSFWSSTLNKLLLLSDASAMASANNGILHMAVSRRVATFEGIIISAIYGDFCESLTARDDFLHTNRKFVKARPHPSHTDTRTDSKNLYVLIEDKN